MTSKNMALLLVLGQEYIRHTDAVFVRSVDSAAEKKQEIEAYSESKKKSLPRAEMNYVFQQISNCYLPLLNMFSSLERDGVPFKISLVITPVLCSLLSDVVVQNQYIEWLDEKIELGNKEIARLSKNKELLNNAKFMLEKVQEDKIDFVNVYECDLLKAFLYWKQKGFVEILATTGTSVFMPFFSDMQEVINAQIETGVMAYKYFFGDVPSGFWISQMGYAKGIEENIRSYGLGYTVLDSQSVLFSDTPVKTGVFLPVRFDNSLGIVARLSETDDLVFGDGGYISNGVYRSKSRDIGFYLESEQITPLVKYGGVRFSTDYGYWNKKRVVIESNSIGDAHGDDVYDVDAAVEQCDKDAGDFISFISKKLDSAERLLPDEKFLSVVCAFDMERLSRDWDECVWWLESVIRKANRSGVSCRTVENLLIEKKSPQKIKPYCGAWCGCGYGENLLSGKNSWMIRYMRKACERMVDLTERFPSDTGLKARLLNLGAKELLISLSSGWQFMIDENFFSEYAKKEFSNSILAFTNVFESLGSNTVSTEWITRMEFERPIFPWMNYRIFSKKQ